MTSPDPNGVQLDRVHSRAIRTEIGERLRAALTGNPNQLSPHLHSLAERFESLECGDVAFRNSIEIKLR
jgi:hypothetical protein